MLLKQLHCCRRGVVAFTLFFYIITRTPFIKMKRCSNIQFTMAEILLRCVGFQISSAEFNSMMNLWQGSLIITRITLEFLIFKGLFQQNFIGGKILPFFSLCMKRKVISKAISKWDCFAYHLNN